MRVISFWAGLSGNFMRLGVGVYLDLRPTGKISGRMNLPAITRDNE
jgi:hypothetical protein